MLAHDREAPDPQAADEDEFRAKSERFEYIRGASNAGVEHYGRFVTHRYPLH